MGVHAGWVVAGMSVTLFSLCCYRSIPITKIAGPLARHSLELDADVGCAEAVLFVKSLAAKAQLFFGICKG